MYESNPWVVVRSKNDATLIRQTLQMIRAQDMRCRILNIDSGSTDGTAEIAAEYADKQICIPAHEYIPGQVLNTAMRETDSEVVVFVNSDATPCDEYWLRSLVTGLCKRRKAAVFGRQVARTDALPWVVFDTERAYGTGEVHTTWEHFFSMANCAVQRSIWQQFPFSSELRYSEDIEWSLRVKQAGGRIGYISNASVAHSHNYSLREVYKRFLGEASADAVIWEESSPTFSLVRKTLCPLLMSWARDTHYHYEEQTLMRLPYALLVRAAQACGRVTGYTKAAR